MAFPLLGTPKPQFFDSSGDLLVSGTLSILEPTNDTNKTYYPTADDADAGTNGASGDITLNSRGEPANALFGVDGEKYKIVLKDSSGTTIYTVDDVLLPSYYYNQGGTGATTRTIVSKLQERVSVLDFGAVGDGATDDSTAIQAAIDYVSSNNSGIVFFPDGDYYLGATLTVSTAGVVLVGVGGHLGRTTLTATHTSGPVVRISQRSCGMQGIRIDSNAARYAASVTDGHGVHYEGPDSAGQSMSRGYFVDVDIRRQPVDGFHVASGFELGLIENLTVSDCKRHGLAMDDGTRSGRTNKDLGPFQFTLRRIRAFENGGNGVLLGASGDTSDTQQCNAETIECLGNCWDSGTRESLYQFDSYCQGLVLVNLDIEDQQYAATTTSSTGSTRTGNATPSHGIRLNSGRAKIYNPYFSSLLSSINIASSVDDVTIEDPRVFQGTYGVDQADAIIVSSSCTGIFVRAATALLTGATDIIQNESEQAWVWIDGKQYKGISLTSSDFEVMSNGATRTVASAVLGVTEDLVFVNGEGGLADTVSTLRVASGFNGSDGLVVRLLNLNSYNITLSHSGNMRFAAGSDKVLSQYQGVTLAYSETASLWIEV